MEIKNYKKLSNGKYKVVLDDRELVLYEEVILKYELLYNKKLDQQLLLEINNTNQEWDVYYTALKSLKSRFKSCKELTILLNKEAYPSTLINKAITKLKEQGYLNDQLFAKAYINEQMITTTNGPLRIKKDLVNKGVSDTLIDEEIKLYTKEEEITKINKIINIMVKGNRNKGGLILKKKIYDTLNTKGYNNTYINEVLDNYDFKIDKSVVEKEYNKLYRTLSRKYSGKELELKIKNKLYQKGLYYED